MEMEMNPVFLLMHHIEVLNLTGSLIEEVDPVDKLEYINFIENLTVLELGENQVLSWNKTIFGNNPKLQRFSMANNGHDIILTEEMNNDFFNNTRLEHLDLSRNTFICSEQVAKFVKLALDRSANLTIQDYNNGSGYFCMDIHEEGQPYSFYNFTTKGFDMYEGVDQTVIRTSWTMVLVGVAVGLVVSSLLVFTLYRQRWYIRYHLLRKKVNREGPFAYDAFISYAKEDENWVMDHLVPQMEAEGVKLCLHTRDFQVGKSIIENIADSIDASRKVVLVLSQQYTASQWCMFEAHMSQHRLVQDNRQSLVLVKLEELETKRMTKEMKYLVSSLTYLAWPQKGATEQADFWRKLVVTFLKKSNSFSIEDKDIASFTSFTDLVFDIN